MLTSWSFQASSDAPNVKLVAGRPTGDPDQFFTVGRSEVKTPAASTTSTYTDISIPVQAGDFLGLRVSSFGDCGDISGGAGYVSRYSAADPSPGTTLTIATLATDDVRLDISATLEPDGDGDGLGDETEDTDLDNDGVVNDSDNCATVANASQANADGDTQGDACDADDDNDGVADAADNCASVANTGQANLDGDALGDACDEDADGDTVADASDNCPTVANPSQVNADGDTRGDACDDTPNGPPPPPADTEAPLLGEISITPAKFKAAKSGVAFVARVGGRVTFSVSEASTVTWTVQRKTKGRKVAGSCKRQTRKNRSKKACTRWVSVGFFGMPVAAGGTSFTFRGRVGTKTLKPGR